MTIWLLGLIAVVALFWVGVPSLLAVLEIANQKKKARAIEYEEYSSPIPDKRWYSNRGDAACEICKLDDLPRAYGYKCKWCAELFWLSIHLNNHGVLRRKRRIREKNYELMRRMGA